MTFRSPDPTSRPRPPPARRHAALAAQKPAAAPPSRRPGWRWSSPSTASRCRASLSYRPWYVAGLKRLLDEGHVEANANYRHINTETGPGHASLGTGSRHASTAS